MKSPDLWFLHCKTKNSRKLQKYPQCLESSKFEDKKSALLGLEPLLVEIEHFLDITQKIWNPGFLSFTCKSAHRIYNLRKDKKLERNRIKSTLFAMTDSNWFRFSNDRIRCGIESIQHYLRWQISMKIVIPSWLNMSFTWRSPLLLSSWI